jgi:hypothetical protein
LSLSTAAAVAIRTVASVLRSMGTQATLSVWQYQVGGFDPPPHGLLLGDVTVICTPIHVDLMCFNRPVMRTALYCCCFV